MGMLNLEVLQAQLCILFRFHTGAPSWASSVSISHAAHAVFRFSHSFSSQPSIAAQRCTMNFYGRATGGKTRHSWIARNRQLYVFELHVIELLTRR